MEYLFVSVCQLLFCGCEQAPTSPYCQNRHVEAVDVQHSATTVFVSFVRVSVRLTGGGGQWRILTSFARLCWPMPVTSHTHRR